MMQLVPCKIFVKQCCTK